MNLVFLDSLTLGNDISLKERFEQFGNCTFHSTTSPNETIERIETADIIFTNKVNIKSKEIDRAKHLQLICVLATGTNNIDIEYATKKGIKVKNVSGYSTHSVAQHTFSMLFYLMGSLRYYDEYVKNSKYIESPIFTHLDRPFQEIKGKTFGIIGLGNIGKKVAEIAEAFGANVIYYSTSGKNNDSKYQRVNFETILSESDILSIHAPLNEQTMNLISQPELSKIKPTAILLNNGRGGIVHEKNLADALNNNQISAAGLDVLSHEPMEVDNPLLSVETHKIFITPHIAWSSKEARESLLDMTVDNVQTFLKTI